MQSHLLLFKELSDEDSAQVSFSAFLITIDPVSISSDSIKFISSQSGYASPILRIQRAHSSFSNITTSSTSTVQSLQVLAGPLVGEMNISILNIRIDSITTIKPA